MVDRFTSASTIDPGGCDWQGFLPIRQTTVMDAGLDQVLTTVGPRLRALRQQHDLTLADLSSATGISLSTLSRLESGQRRPTLELLLPLAREYHVPLDELIGTPAADDPRVHALPFTQHGVTYQPLARRPGGLQAYKLIIPATRPHVEPDPQAHEGFSHALTAAAVRNATAVSSGILRACALRSSFARTRGRAIQLVRTA